MNLTDTEILKFLRGSPVFIDDICAVFPATLGEIVDIGYDNFQRYLSIITATKPDKTKVRNDNDLINLLDELSDFQYILLLTKFDDNTYKTLKESFKFFCHEDVIFSFDPAQIVIGPLEEKHILTEEKFYEFRQIIRYMYFLDIASEDVVINEKDDPRVRAIKEKIRKGNQTRQEIRKKEAQSQGIAEINFSDLIGSIPLNDCNLSIENIWGITYYAFHDQLKRMGWRDQFNINHRAALAGAKISNKQLKHWIRSIKSYDEN